MIMIKIMCLAVIWCITIETMNYKCPHSKIKSKLMDIGQVIVTIMLSFIILSW